MTTYAQIMPPEKESIHIMNLKRKIEWKCVMLLQKKSWIVKRSSTYLLLIINVNWKKYWIVWFLILQIYVHTWKRLSYQWIYYIQKNICSCIKADVEILRSKFPTDLRDTHGLFSDIELVKKSIGESDTETIQKGENVEM